MPSIAENITAMIKARGRACKVRTVTNSGTEFDPTQSNADADAFATFTNFKMSDVDGSLIQADDKRVHLSATVPVTKQNKIIDGTIVYQIEALREVMTGDDLFVYIAQCRK